MNDFSYKPAYKVIMDDILKDIANGEYTPDEMIPSQAQLADTYKVSRITARDAINKLTHRGILYTKQGKGTFVSIPAKFNYPSTRSQSFSRGMSGQALETKVLKLEYREADQKFANKFELAVGTKLVYLQRLRIVEGIPVVVTTTNLDQERFSTIDFMQEDLSAHSLYQTLQQKAGLDILYVDEEVRAVHCPLQIAQLLGIDEGEPVLYIKRATYEQSERCFEWGEQYERTDVAGMKLRSYNK